jgi:ornithine cyclodeaminase/alanine dehydrogenase-like protein (mu-crystallin family)
MSVRVVGHEEVLELVSPEMAIERVRDAFIRHQRGEWQMPSKVYLDSSPYGDFRAMPALGNGVAILKWVTSFPGNPARGHPTVYGTIFVSDAATGEPKAIVDGRSVTALRTGAAAAVASSALAASGERTVGLVGCGLHGAWAARCLKAAGFHPGVCSDVIEDAARKLADELGWQLGSIEDALACDVVTLVTPGNQPVLTEDHLRPGLHVNALGADGPGKAEISLDAVARCRIFCDEWDQASHGGEIHTAVEKGLVDRASVADLGGVLTGEASGRTDDDEMTLFDSTGLAIQDLAICLAVIEQLGEGPTVEL